MNDLLQMRLFCLLTQHSKQSTNEEIVNAYGCFMEQVKIVSQSENLFSEVYRMLNNTRVELLFIESLYRHEQEKKCLKICLPEESNLIS